MGSTTVLHLVFPTLISFVGIIMLLRAVKKQRHLRRQYRLVEPQIAVDEVTTETSQTTDTSPITARTSALTREDQRLAKLGFNDLQSTAAEDEFDMALAEQPAASCDETTDSQPVAEYDDVAPPDVIILHIFAKNNRRFVGYELLQAILACGFRFGDMDIFHRHQHANGRGKVLFSLASAVEPGTFDMNAMGGYTCLGLTLFMHPTEVKQAIAVFDLMLNTARELAKDLEGVVLDENRQPLHADTVADIRYSLQSLSDQTGQAQLDFSLDD